MKKTPMLSALAVFLILAAGCGKKPDASSAPGTPSAAVQPAPKEPVDLKLKLPPGTKFPVRIEVVQGSEMRIPAMPKPMVQQVELNQEMTFTVVKEYEGGGREAELEFGDVDMSVSMNGNEAMAFDSRGESAGDAENPAASAFRKMVGAKLKYILDASNHVEKVEGVDELVAKITGGGRGAQMMGSMFTESYFKQIADFGHGLPNRPVQPGDTWTEKRNIVMGPLGPATLDLKYTFKNWEQHENRQCARLEFSGPITGDPNATNAGVMGVRFNILDGTTTGQSWFDPAAGMMVDAAFDQKMNLLMNFSGTNAAGRAAGPAGGMTNAFNQRIRVKLLSDAK